MLRLPLTISARTLRDLGIWLGAPPPNDIYHDSSEKRLENTCEWILHRDIFLQWQVPSTTAKVLWIRGPAGFGKTILCAKLVQEIERTTTAPMAYFFLSTKFEGRENPFLAMRSWLTSLVLKSQVAFDIVSKHRLSQIEERASQSTIVRLFREVSMAIPGCIFVLDGLDECTGMADTDTKSVSHFLSELRKAIAKTNTRLLILSRPAAVIQQGLSLFPGYSIYDIELDDVGPDLAVFASDVVERKLTTKDEEWKLSIAQKIKDRCKGQFQWVKLQEGSLRRGLSKRHLERVIDQTPSGLDALYDREWDRINSMGSEDKQRALSLLRWAAFAVNPLTAGQIAEAVLITDDYEELQADERPECIDEDYIESMILDLCGSLLEVKQLTVHDANGDVGSPIIGADHFAEAGQHKEAEFEPLPSDQKVHLTHFSVKEYLLLKLSPPGVLLPDEKLRSSIESREHTHLAKCCLRYMTWKGVWDKWLEQDNKDHSMQFLYYAAKNWQHHYKLVRTLDYDLKAAIWTLFDAESETGFLWRHLAKNELCPSNTQGGNSKVPSPLQVAASMNLTHVVARLLHEGNVDPNDLAENGCTALHFACACNNKETATLLLGNGAGVDARDIHGLTALHVASMFERRELVTLLIERGADVNARGNLDGTPLLYTSTNQQNDVASLLLDAGADPHLADTDGQTPLAEATARNRIDTVQLFLDRGVYNGNEFGANGNELGLSLCIACGRGFLEVAKLLVNRGADASFRTTSGQTPLLAAVRGGHLEIISLLFDEIGSTHELNRDQTTLLHHASLNKDPCVAKLLLERGADIEAKDRLGMRPIYYASFYGLVKTVNLLVESGADIRAKDYIGRTPLSYTAERGHNSVVQLLLSKSRDNPDPADCCCRNILHYACKEGHDEIVKFLIQRGQDKPSLDQRDCWGSTPLSIAVRRGHIDVVKTLLATNLVDATSKDDLGRTLVWWAMRQQQAELLDLLIGTNEQLSCGFEEDNCLEVPGRSDPYCDICWFGSSKQSSKQLFFTCAICFLGQTDLRICPECFARGGHCFDTGHQLLIRQYT